jgi:hypothetical protein
MKIDMKQKVGGLSTKTWLIISFCLIVFVALVGHQPQKETVEQVKEKRNTFQEIDFQNGERVKIQTRQSNTSEQQGRVGTHSAYDLDEAARNFVFYRNKILVESRKGNEGAAQKARMDMQACQKWLDEYPPSEVSAAVDRATERFIKQYQ